MSDTPVSLVCCDLAGTVAADGSLLEKAYAEAIATQGVVPGTAAYARSMVQVDRAGGSPPRDVMHMLFDDPGRAQAAYVAFERSCHAVLDRFGVTTAPGAREAIAKMSASGLKVCLMSGLSRAISRLMLDRLGVSRLPDLTLCLDDAPRGCPWPDPVLTAAIRVGVGDVAEIAVVGGDENVILAGRRAGAGVLVGLTGNRTAQRLRAAGATHLIKSLADLPEMLLPDGPEAGAERPGGAAGKRSTRDSPGVPRPATCHPG